MVHVVQVDNIAEFGIERADGDPDMVSEAWIGRFWIGLVCGSAELLMRTAMLGARFDPIRGFVLNDPQGPWAEPVRGPQ